MGEKLLHAIIWIVVVIAIVLAIVEGVGMLWLKISVISNLGDAPEWLKWILIFK